MKSSCQSFGRPQGWGGLRFHPECGAFVSGRPGPVGRPTAPSRFENRDFRTSTLDGGNIRVRVSSPNGRLHDPRGRDPLCARRRDVRPGARRRAQPMRKQVLSGRRLRRPPELWNEWSWCSLLELVAGGAASRLLTGHRLGLTS